FFFFSSRRRHTRSDRDWSSDVCSSDLGLVTRLSWVISPSSGRRYSCGNGQNRCKIATPCCIVGIQLMEQNLTFDLDALLVFGKEIGRASCRGSGWSGVVDVGVKRKSMV